MTLTRFTQKVTATGKQYRQPTAEYAAFTHAKMRCCNTQCPAYPSYGGRGIEFRFMSFEDFMYELGPRPNSSASLDRINNDGHYEKGNVRWTSMKEQSRNRRSQALLTFQGRTQSIAAWAEELNQKVKPFYDRKRRGWCVTCIFAVPIGSGTMRGVPKGQQQCSHQVIREVSL